MTPLTELALFTTTTLFGCIHSLVGLPWKNNSMDIGSVLLCSWLLVGSFVLFVNSLAMNAMIWCDICEYFCNTTGRSQGTDYPYDGYSYQTDDWRIHWSPCVDDLCLTSPLHDHFCPQFPPQQSAYRKLNNKPLPYVLCSSDSISSFANSLLCWACLH